MPNCCIVSYSNNYTHIKQTFTRWDFSKNDNFAGSLLSTISLSHMEVSLNRLWGYSTKICFSANRKGHVNEREKFEARVHHNTKHSTQGERGRALDLMRACIRQRQHEEEEQLCVIM